MAFESPVKVKFKDWDAQGEKIRGFMHQNV